MINKKLFRYYYWLFIEFFKKNSQLIFISFFTSFVFIVVFLSVSPYIKVLFVKERKIGLVGNYDLNNPPEEIVKNISNGLVTVSNKGEIIPVIASSWEVKDNAKKYRFHLKDNLLWNNGEKFKPQEIDFKFIDVQVKIIDDRTIDFLLEKPLEIFPTYLDKPIIKYPLIGVGGFYKVGKIKLTGGFLKEVILVPNIKDLVPLRYKFFKNDTQLVNAYKRGEITEMTVSKKIIADNFSSWKNSQVIRSVDYSKLLTVFFNFNNPIFNNKNFRQALTMIVDLQKLSQYGEVAKGPIPPTSWAYNKDLKSYSYDFEKAKKIIDKENLSSQSAPLKLVTFFDYYEIADSFAEELRKLGLNVNVEIVSFLKPNDFDLLIALWKVPNDPDQYYFWHSTQKEGNIGNYKNVKVDLLLEKGRSTIDFEKRQEYYFDFQKAITEDPPGLFFYYPYIYTIKRK